MTAANTRDNRPAGGVLEVIGWRAKIGVIVPSCNTVMETELFQMVPEGVSVHFARARSVRDTPEELQRLVDEVPHAAQELADAKVDIIAFGCTGGSFFGGPGYDQKVIKAIGDSAGIRGTTTSTAVVAALKTLRLSRISVATPYEDWLNEAEVKFLRSHGIEVERIKGLGIPDPQMLERQVPQVAYGLAREVNAEKAQGLFISCTDFRNIEIIDVLEHDTGKPVVTSNQATLWMCLLLLGIKPEIKGYGCLFDHL